MCQHGFENKMVTCKTQNVCHPLHWIPPRPVVKGWRWTILPGHQTLISALFAPLLLHAGSAPTHYNKHCLEQSFQLSTCPVDSQERCSFTLTDADYTPHNTYVLRNCGLDSNYQCHWCSPVSTVQGVKNNVCWGYFPWRVCQNKEQGW